MNIRKAHWWRSSSRAKVRAVVTRGWYYRIDFIGNPDTWKVEAIPPQGDSETHYFGSRDEAQEFLQSKR